MPPEPVPAEPEWDDDPAWTRPDPMTAAERQASLDRLCEQDEGHLEDEDEDDYGGFEPFTVQELAEIREAAADELLAVEAATTGRRGPGQPGSARVFPGQSSSPAASFGPGMPLDVLPGCAALAVAADAAAGEDDRFGGVSEAELVGMVCAWDRVEAHSAARKLAAIAELARRSPAPDDAEFTVDELANALAESRGRADTLIDLAQTLETRLPGTAAALDDGTITLYKAEIITRATALLDDAEARAAEQKVLDRATRLTPGGLRAAIAQAVMEVAPKKAKERREQAAKDARVERWAEDSGNAALMGCELPPDEVLAADQRITAWAKELRRAGLEGDMDQLRARAFLDLLLGKDSRPRHDSGGNGGPGPEGPDAPPSSPGPVRRRGARRVRRAGHLDRPAGHRDRAGRPARRARRDRPGRPVAGPRPGHRGRAEPQDDLVRDRDRPRRPRHRARLRPARTQSSPETRRTRPARTNPVHLHPGQPGRAARRVRHLAAAHPRTRAGPDRHPGIPDHRPLRPPAPGQRPRPRGQAAAPDPGPARHLHQPHLPAARRPVRRRAQHPVRSRRPDLPLQHRPQMPPRPPPQTAPQVEGRPAPRRHLPLDHPSRTHLHHRTHPVPDLTVPHRVRGLSMRSRVAFFY